MNEDELFAAIVEASRRASAIPGPDPRSVTAPPPLSSGVFHEHERRLGCRLPSFLCRLYTQFANGHVGPGDGLLSLAPVSPSDQSIRYFYGTFREARMRDGYEWERGVIPFCHWGDLILSCIDLNEPANADDPPVLRLEPNMERADTYRFLGNHQFRGVGLIPERDHLSLWFEDWVAGVEMFHRPYRI